MDRRAAFFVVAGTVCGALAPATDSELRWVPFAAMGLYFVLALASWLDSRSRFRGDG